MPKLQIDTAPNIPHTDFMVEETGESEYVHVDEDSVTRSTCIQTNPLIPTMTAKTSHTSLMEEETSESASVHDEEENHDANETSCTLGHLQDRFTDAQIEEIYSYVRTLPQHHME